MEGVQSWAEMAHIASPVTDRDCLGPSRGAPGSPRRRSQKEVPEGTHLLGCPSPSPGPFCSQ